MIALPLLLLAQAAAFQDAFRAGLVALNRGDLSTAQTQLETAAKMEPGKPEVWVGLAQTYWRERKLDDAQSAVSKAERLNPKAPDALHAVALYYFETRNLEKAGEWEARYARAAIRQRHHEEAYYFGLGQELLRLQQFQAALETAEAGKALFPRSAQLELARGVALYGLRRFPDAIDSFLRTIQLAPDVPQPYDFLGRMLDVAEGRLPAITNAFAAYAKSRTGVASSSLLYAKALRAGSGDPAQIESLLHKSIALDDRSWEAHFELGLLLERRRAYEQAAGELERSVELNPAAAATHYRLARVYDRLGRGADADRQREIQSQLTSSAKSGQAGVK